MQYQVINVCNEKYGHIFDLSSNKQFKNQNKLNSGKFIKQQILLDVRLRTSFCHKNQKKMAKLKFQSLLILILQVKINQRIGKN